MATPSWLHYCNSSKNLQKFSLDGGPFSVMLCPACLHEVIVCIAWKYPFFITSFQCIPTTKKCWNGSLKSADVHSCQILSNLFSKFRHLSKMLQMMVNCWLVRIQFWAHSSTIMSLFQVQREAGHHSNEENYLFVEHLELKSPFLNLLNVFF